MLTVGGGGDHTTVFGAKNLPSITISTGEGEGKMAQWIHTSCPAPAFLSFKIISDGAGTA